MNTVQQTKQGGFTIIEVVLVLAIAGLIFLMVFIALPALQRNQRDTQRRDDVARAVSQLQSFATNNRGQLPPTGDFAGFLGNYMRAGGQEFNDPRSGNPYQATDNTPGENQIQYVQQSRCGDGETLVGGQGARQAAVRVQLESGGIFCQSVQS